MPVVGTVDHLARYPVKSMRGETLEEAFVGFAGVYGDRIWAFTSTASPKGFPFLTARDQGKMLLCQPRFRHPDKAARPLNLAEAQRLGPGITPLYADAADWMVDVQTSSGETLAIDDPSLIRLLGEGVDGAPSVALIRSERALTDCRPLSLFSLQTARQIGQEAEIDVDPRRFRANLYLDLFDAGGFGEDAFVGRTLRVGSQVVIRVLERDPRCRLITLDPETGISNPALLRPVAQAHGGMAGVYAAVLVEGMVTPGDAIELLD